jgi:hypothetical protein
MSPSGLYYKHITIAMVIIKVMPQFEVSLWQHNEGKSAARVCRQAAALVPDTFSNFHLVKNHKTANNSAST